MNLSKREVTVGFVVVVLVVFGLLYFFSFRKKDDISPTPPPPSIEYKQDFEREFKYDIPENTAYIELKSVTGGDERGLATKNEILVDTKDPEEGYFYQAWLEKDGDFISLGKLQIAKGGFILSFDSTKYPEYKKVVISKEKVLDKNLETKILEGSF